MLISCSIIFRFNKERYLFEAINFNNLNETDIREEVLAPLLRRLGYRSGTNDNVIREQSLRYPRVFIGRKKSNKDPLLRGIADYILEAGLKVRWIIEAKSPDAELDLESIEQAYTYANHPEVRAVYFVLSNGKKLVVFQTNQGPNSNPLIDFSYDELENKYKILEGLLSPASILRDHPSIELDLREPIGNGLRSVVRITNGLISYFGSSVNIPAINEMNTSISDGAVERDENGQLVAYLNTVAPTRSMQNLNQRLGLTSFEMYSDDSFISNDPASPTIFKSEQSITLPVGERILDINSWKQITIPHNIKCNVITQARGHLENNKFHGSFVSIMNFLDPPQQIKLNGKYEMFVG